jgi:hypothetical protein
MQASCAGHCQHSNAVSCAILSVGQLHRRFASDEGLGGLSGCQEQRWRGHSLCDGGGAGADMMIPVAGMGKGRPTGLRVCWEQGSAS